MAFYWRISEKEMTRLVLGFCLLGGLLMSGGCGGNYILTVPDMIAPAGGEGVAVVRLQRADFLYVPMAVKEALIELQVGDEPHRGAYTDSLGYAGTTLPSPEKPGQYKLQAGHSDHWGDEVRGESRAYVWDPKAPAVAVDLDCLPGMVLGFSKESSLALVRAAKGANILYLTRRSSSSHAKLHAQLAKAGYPDGPILEWQRQYWHIVRDGKYNMPRVVVENRLVSQLADIRAMLPGLATGICDGSLAAKAFAESNMRVVVVGGASVAGKDVVRRGSWSELAEKGS
jgi:hypothetical protein